MEHSFKNLSHDPKNFSIVKLPHIFGGLGSDEGLSTPNEKFSIPPRLFV